jgi:ABC-type amino acid transport substrate-binding protein
VDAEYLALTRLQADAFATPDPALAGRVVDLVQLAPIDAVTTAS